MTLPNKPLINFLLRGLTIHSQSVPKGYQRVFFL